MKATIVKLTLPAEPVMVTGLKTQATLKRVFEDDFLIGSALNESQFFDSAWRRTCW